MDRKEINQLLENIEEHVMQILETADLLDILVRSVFRSFPGKNDSWTGRGLPHE